MISNIEYKTIAEYAETQALDGLWAYLTPDMLPSLHAMYDNFPFQERKKIFLCLIPEQLQASIEELIQKTITVISQSEDFGRLIDKEINIIDD
ncbi:hypothetical protein [Providencia hangzhouensis]|uniref:hypothetical protein n=1 Tax=Providencia hangzhouensis TaxID=3031799 RepID=UPI003977FF4A